MELQKYKLGDIAEIIVGFPFESEKFNIEGHGVRLVRGMNVSERYLRFGEDARWWNEISDKLRPYYLQENDILIGMDGSKVGKNFALVKKEDLPLLLVQRVACIRAKKGFDQRFIWHYVSSPRFVEYVNTIKTGSAIPHISSSQIGDFPIYTPLLEEQEKIASVLSALDDKIALNRAINQNLEALAKQIYDYWFVQFDFPNEEGKPYKSSGGKMVWNKTLKRDIPVSYEVKTVNEIADVFNGATPSTGDEQNYGGDIVWITPKDLSDQKQKFVYHGERNISQRGYDSCSTHLLPPNTVLMSSRAPIGLLAIAKTELCTNQGFKSFVPKETRIATYLYYYLQFHIKQIEQLGTGTTFKEVSREDVLKFPILKPSDKFLDLWEERVFAINEKQLELQKEIENLTKQRDELLPLLMNGQVTID